MDESEFEFNGKKYESIESVSCDGCEFVGFDESCNRPINFPQYCSQSNRNDRLYVIFVEKQP